MAMTSPPAKMKGLVKQSTTGSKLPLISNHIIPGKTTNGAPKHIRKSPAVALPMRSCRVMVRLLEAVADAF